jgi:protein-tyrosine-phosphatase
MARRILARMREQQSQLMSSLRTADTILFLCQGNINRSAFAAHKTRVTLPGDSTLHLASAGFVPEEGRQPSRYSVMVAKTFGVDLSGHTSQIVTHELLTKSGVLFVMDRHQLQQLHEMDASVLQRTALLGALDQPTSDWEIEDPDGKDYESYYRTYAKICRCIDAWLRLRQGH